MPKKSNPPATIDDYFQGCPRELRSILQRIRRIVRRAAPEAVEVISYRMPAFKLNGIIIYFAAFKNHVGIFPPIKGDPKLVKALAPYAGPKGNLRFSLDEPIPYGLIERLVKHRVKQNRAKAAKAKIPRRPKSHSYRGS